MDEKGFLIFLTHPIGSQLQACESPGHILAVFPQRIQGLDQSDE
jgi:hypothetical protein